MSANTIQFRSSERLRISLPVQVLVNDRSEPLECETLLVNLNGCGLRTSVSIPVGSKLRVRNGKDEIPGRVVTCIQTAGSNAFSVGVKFEQPYYWPVPNSPSDWGTGPASKHSQPSASKAGKSKQASPPSASDNVDSETSDDSTASVAVANQAAVSQSQEVIKQLDEAVARAMTVARKLDAVAQLLPEQLESRLKQKAEEAAEAAQAAAVAGMQDRIDKHVEQRTSSIKAERIEQYTADLDAKLRDADQVRKSLAQAEGLLDQIHRASEEFRTHSESSRDQIHRESAEVKTQAARSRDQLNREAEEFRENLASESRKAVEELLSSAASLQVAAVDLEQQTIESVRQQIQSALDESLAKFEKHVKAASQRFASALHAAASHASQPADPDASDEVGVATSDQANRAGTQGDKKRRS